jgi:peptidoglycan/xylan/chitin deacetylase (PgdA/CDA1 family)
MSKKQKLAQVLVKGGAIPLFNAFWGRERLTVLAYHRIIDYQRPDFADYLPVVSATPAMFEQQMAFVRDHFHVISLDDLHRALTAGAPLPDNPLLITFDDGYLDNYTNAYPILKRFGFPAVIFLATSRMDDPTPLWWDAVARYFHHTPRTEAKLPLVGEVALGDDRRALLDRLLGELKTLPEADKQAAVEQVRAALAVTDPDDAPLFMSWDQVREVVSNGVDCQAHTVTHPIMTRISVDEQHRQLERSRAHIMEQTGKDVAAFAYPNGTHADYAPETMRLLQDTSYKTAFTLTAGPMRWRQVKVHPLQIRRVYLGYQDTFELFALKVMGLPALFDRIAFPAAPY